MERVQVVLCAFMGFFGLLSAAFAFAAEATRGKASNLQAPDPGHCANPKSFITLLPEISAYTLFAAQAMMNFLAECVCCKRQTHLSDKNWTVALFSYIVSWITFIIAVVLLMMGLVHEMLHDHDQRDQESEHCFVVKPGVFASGGVLSLASVALGIVYYVAISSSKSVQVQPWESISGGVLHPV